MWYSSFFLSVTIILLIEHLIVHAVVFQPETDSPYFSLASRHETKVNDCQ